MTVEKRINYAVNKGDINEGPKSSKRIAGGEYNRVIELLEKIRESGPLSEEEKIEMTEMENNYLSQVNWQKLFEN